MTVLLANGKLLMHVIPDASGRFQGGRQALVHFALLTLIAAGLHAVNPAYAGLSAENVIVVVNGKSAASHTIANHFVALRNIPDKNVVVLPDVPDGVVIKLDEFKTQILKPLLEEVNRRGLARQVRVIAYSGDFPTSVRVTEHRNLIKNEAAKKLLGGMASITGATYFYQFVLADNPGYMQFGANMYTRQPFQKYFANPFSGEKGVQFNTAQQHFDQKRYAEAGVAFKTLHAEHPTLAPLAIQAARSFAQADDTKKATQMLLAAIKAGWWSSKYLREQEELATVLKDPNIKKLIGYLDGSPTIMQTTQAFDSSVAWTSCGFPVRGDQGLRYLMSCSLAVLHERGSTVEQAIEVLKRSSQADRTYPKGEFRFAGGADVRAKTRFPGVADALLYLNEAGYQTEVFNGRMSLKPGDINGMLFGTAGVPFETRVWQFVPGAIGETLTSYGGTFEIKGHTKITEFLHAGAAMSSGTVTEPYALQPKFPLPMMHAYYAQGVSAIEAFYLSISCPYQLLIVGDPLCQPFAKPPADWIDFGTAKADNVTTMSVTRRSLKNNIPSTPMRNIELFFDGKLAMVSPAKNANVKLPPDASGVVDVRAVSTGFHSSQPRLSFQKQIDLNGKYPTPNATIDRLPRSKKAAGGDGTTNDKRLSISVQCRGADRIAIQHFGEVIGVLEGDRGSIEIDISQLGAGPVSFRPVASFKKVNVGGFTITHGSPPAGE